MGITLSFAVFIPQLFGQAVRRPSQFSKCACQEQEQKEIKTE